MSNWHFDPVGAALGRYADVKAVYKFGYNPAVATATDPEDVWDGGGLWVPPTQARVHSVVSSSENDTAAGTGARTIRLYGLRTWDEDETYEDVTLSGATPVNTTNSYVIIHRMFVLTAGSGGVNAGNITATAATDGTVTAQITANEAQTLMAVYGIGRPCAFLVTDIFMGGVRSGGTSNTLDTKFMANFTPDVNLNLWRIQTWRGLNSTGTSSTNNQIYPPIRIPGPAILRVEVAEVSATMGVFAGFNGFKVYTADGL